MIIVDDIINYHFKDKENLMAEALIYNDIEFAEGLLNELQMQLMLKQMNIREQKDK